MAVSRWAPLFLTKQTIERRAAGLHDAFDLALAARTRRTLAVIDLETVLEIAERAVGTAVVAQRRAAGLNRVLEHRLDGIDQRAGTCVRLTIAVGDSGSKPLGSEPRAEQRLADIDVAEPGDHALIAERGFQRGLLA